MSSFNGATPNFDSLLLHSLMNRLQIRPQPPSSAALNHHQSLEDLLLDAASNFQHLSDSDSEDESRSQLSKEESKLEKEIIKVILSGKTESLKPNSGQAVAIGEHHVCVGFHEESGSEYRVWEWHGHVMLFDEDNGYSPEYIYGNYFERVPGRVGGAVERRVEEEEEEREEKVENLGLRELIENGDSSRSRVVHRSLNAGSTRF